MVKHFNFKKKKQKLIIVSQIERHKGLNSNFTEGEGRRYSKLGRGNMW